LRLHIAGNDGEGSLTSFRFEGFSLDEPNRQLLGAEGPVELNGRYFDALALLVREQGRLVPKTRFLDEIWRGVPVTDEALTQCIKTLRRQLGDDASNPRFIETVPKHGYRFIARVERAGSETRVSAVTSVPQGSEPIVIGGAIGGALAGLIGGLIYALGGAAQGIGAISALLVLLCITGLVALIGAAGVSFGIATARRSTGRPSHWDVVGGVLGGLIVGAGVKLLGTDAVELLFGQSPGDITGAAEGAVLGGVIGAAAWLGNSDALRRTSAAAAVAGGLAGVLISLFGGRLMGGSLDVLARSFPHSRLRMDEIGRFFGENEFGQPTQMVTGALEGALFAGCVIGVMILAERRSRPE
jgi:DNA-binding winged helix-turn-helix (wHTH) protein